MFKIGNIGNHTNKDSEHVSSGQCCCLESEYIINNKYNINIL